MAPLSRMIAYSPRWDALGTCCSAACIAHCLMLPALLAVLPAAGVLKSEGVHLLLLASVAGFAALAFAPCLRGRGRRLPLLFALSGLAALAVGGLAAESLFGENAAEAAESGLTLAGGTLMVLAHGLNRMAYRTGRHIAEPPPCC